MCLFMAQQVLVSRLGLAVGQEIYFSHVTVLQTALFYIKNQITYNNILRSRRSVILRPNTAECRRIIVRILPCFNVETKTILIVSFLPNIRRS